MKIIGHKGAAWYATENTIESFVQAIKIWCDRAELDVRVTKDNFVVVFHDKELSKLTNWVWTIEELNLNEIKKLSYWTWWSIPTLQDVIDVCKDKIDLQIELKWENTPILVNEIVKKNKLEKNVVITSFKKDYIKQIKLLNPILTVWLLFWKDEDLEYIWDLIREIPLDFLAPSSSIVTDDLVKRAHSLNKVVYAYMVNDIPTYNKLILMGVDEIWTDFPKLFK